MRRIVFIFSLMLSALAGYSQYHSNKMNALIFGGSNV